MPVTWLAKVNPVNGRLVELTPLLYASVTTISLYVVAADNPVNVIDVGWPVIVFDWPAVTDEIVMLLISYIDGDVGRV